MTETTVRTYAGIDSSLFHSGLGHASSRWGEEVSESVSYVPDNPHVFSGSYMGTAVSTSHWFDWQERFYDLLLDECLTYRFPVMRHTHFRGSFGGFRVISAVVSRPSVDAEALADWWRTLLPVREKPVEEEHVPEFVIDYGYMTAEAHAAAESGDFDLDGEQEKVQSAIRTQYAYALDVEEDDSGE